MFNINVNDIYTNYIQNENFEILKLTNKIDLILRLLPIAIKKSIKKYLSNDKILDSFVKVIESYSDNSIFEFNNLDTISQLINKIEENHQISLSDISKTNIKQIRNRKKGNKNNKKIKWKETNQKEKS